MQKEKLIKVSILFTRFALAASYLSAVADRFGYWGKAGEEGVAWGNFDVFLQYTAILNSWASDYISNFLGYFVTGLEVIISILLIVGFKIRIVSLSSFFLLAAFFLSMTFSGFFKGALDYNVFTAAAASLLLFAYSDSLKES